MIFATSYKSVSKRIRSRKRKERQAAALQVYKTGVLERERDDEDRREFQPWWVEK